MKSIKLTKAQYISIRPQLPIRHIACKERTSTGVVSEYTRTIAYKNKDLK